MIGKRKFFLGLGVSVFALSASPLVEAADPLGSYNIDRDRITVSGISSGGFMAHQLHIAYSDEIAGAGIVAAGPYRCVDTHLREMNAHSRLDVALIECSGFAREHLPGGRFLGPPNLEPLIEMTDFDQNRHVIADPANLCGDRVYLFSGLQDTTVPTEVVDVLRDYYDRFFAQCADSTAAAQPAVEEETRVSDSVTHQVTEHGPIKYVRISDAPHAFLTNADPDARPCEAGGAYITDCNYEMAHDILSHLYAGTDIQPPATDVGEVLAFDQGDIGRAVGVSNVGHIGMGEVGHVYVPSDCQDGAACGVHIAIHGCRQTQDAIGDRFFTETDYNSWAESNDVIVLYPQTRDLVSNPYQCWDWWGFTGIDFYQRTGPQPRVIWGMVERLLGEG